MPALRLFRRLAQVLLRIKIELLFAFGAAEVVRLSFVLALSSGGSRFYVHAANMILHSCCALHCGLSLVRDSCLDGSIGRFQQPILRQLGVDKQSLQFGNP
jgi:hypothetical protein